MILYEQAPSESQLKFVLFLAIYIHFFSTTYNICMDLFIINYFSQ